MNFSRMVLSLLGWVAGLAAAAPVLAQDVAIPNLWDPRARQERPDLSGLRTVRFLTDDDFPPLHFVGPDGVPTGFSVELARAACERLGITCTIQARRFDTLADALSEARGDVIAAAMPITPALRRRFSVTLAVFPFPGAFCGARRQGPAGAEPARARRPHRRRRAGDRPRGVPENLLRARDGARLRRSDRRRRRALRRGEADYVFGDGLGLSLWLGGTDAAGCCGFIGGPYIESRFFGEGIGFIVRKDDEILRRAFDHALQRLWDEGKYAELYLRFFPVSPF